MRDAMKCTLCGCEFNEEQVESACKGCPTIKGCRLIRCPNCGFETPPEPRWFKHLKKRSNADEAQRQGRRDT